MQIRNIPMTLALIVSLVFIGFACDMPEYSMPWFLVVIAAVAIPVFAYMGVKAAYEEENKTERKGI